MVSTIMDYESIDTGLKCIAAAVAAWPVCKYVIKPFMDYVVEPTIARGIDNPTRNDLEQQRLYNEIYNTVVAQRTKLAAELGTAGRSSDDISQIVDHNLPLPKK